MDGVTFGKAVIIGSGAVASALVIATMSVVSAHPTIALIMAYGALGTVGVGSIFGTVRLITASRGDVKAFTAFRNYFRHQQKYMNEKL